MMGMDILEILINEDEERNLDLAQQDLLIAQIVKQLTQKRRRLRKTLTTQITEEIEEIP
jgi:hypothetical protein